MKGRAIEALARDILNDPEALRWDADHVARGINATCLYIADKRPDSCAVTKSLPLAAGSLQTVAGMTPPGLRWLAVPCNTNGPSVTPQRAQDLDAFNRNWRKASPSKIVKHVVQVEGDQRTFYVCPPAAAGAALDVTYLPKPVEITPDQLDSVELSLLDTFLEPAAMHLLGLLYLMEAPAGKAELAAAYLSRCDTLLGVKPAAAPAQGAA